MSSSNVVFTDVTAEAGIDHTQRLVPVTFAPGVDIHNFMSGGAAAGDFDGDGFVDLYFTRLDGTDILYRNLGDGTFEDVTVQSGIDREFGSNGVGTADIDNDGDLDLYVTSVFDDRFYLLINDGAGRFSEQAIERGAATEGADEHFGMSVSFGDYDLDGYLDLSIAEWRSDALNPTGAPSNSLLLHNLGAENPGYFEDVTLAAGVATDDIPGDRAGTFAFSPRWADLDNDGLPDLTMANDFTESRLFWNNGDGTFTDGTASAGVGTDHNGMGSAIADVNGDGLLDWFVTAIWLPPRELQDGNRLFLNNGDRTFTDVTTESGVRDGGWGWGATFIDYDNDGDQDLVHTNGWPNGFTDDQTRFFENDGSGHFTEIASDIGITDTAEGKGLLKLDYDNDGDQDILVINNHGAPVLYRNDGGNANDWLKLGTFGPMPAVGASVSVTLEPGGAVQVQEINADSNFLAQDEATLHFGLGSGSASVESVVVTWLSGESRTLTDVPRNMTISIAQGESNDVYDGGDGRDWIDGGAGADALSGGAGDDVLVGGAGKDLLLGDAGFDLAQFDGNQEDYLIEKGNGFFLVTDLARGEQDALVGIEGLRFGDGDLIFSMPVYRFFDARNGSHLLTTDQQERDALIEADDSFIFDGAVFGTAAAGGGDTIPVWRLYNEATGEHLYTTSEAERDLLLDGTSAFALEGVAFDASATDYVGGAALYRFFDGGSGMHIYTANDAERDAILADLPQFELEGIVGYVDQVF